jgi:hypothetical protein
MLRDLDNTLAQQHYKCFVGHSVLWKRKPHIP